MPPCLTVKAVPVQPLQCSQFDLLEARWRDAIPFCRLPHVVHPPILKPIAVAQHHLLAVRQCATHSSSSVTIVMSER